MDESKMAMIQYPSHEHPLVLREVPDRRPGVQDRRPIFLPCNICGSFIYTDIHYACLECGYMVHVFCIAPFLRNINHPSHPQHSLTLNIVERPNYDDECCPICDSYSDCSFYNCDFGCQFRLDIYCALRIPTAICKNKEKGGREQVPFCHNQPTESVEVEKYYGADDVKKIKCYICEVPLSSSTSHEQAFTCKICKCFFHKSCTELPPKTRHPDHLEHLLVFQLSGRRDKDVAKCGVCHKTGFNFIYYSCSVRNFYMCIVCCSPTRTLTTITYEGHDHLLHLRAVAPKDENIKCCSASYTCWKESVVAFDEHNIRTERYRFFCETCDFSLHLLCGPLPRSIKHNCHVHPLTLFDSIVEDNSGEYYCDTCETKRNPRNCVYYCGECKYIAHLDCVIDEVVRILQGDCSDIDLRIVGRGKLFIEMDRHNDVMLENEKMNIIEELKEEKEKEFKPTILLDIIVFIAKDLHKDYSKLEEKQEKELLELEEILEINHDMNREEISRNYLGAFRTMNSLIVKKQDVAHQRSNSTEGREQEEESIQSFEKLFNKLNNFDYPTRCNKVTVNDLRLKLVSVGHFVIPWNLAKVLKYILVNHGDISDENTWDSKWKKSLIFFLLCRLLHSMSNIMVEDVTEDLLGDWYSCLRFVKSNGFKVDFINSRLQELVRLYIGLQTSRQEIEKENKMDKEIANLEAKLKRCKEVRQRYKTSKRLGSFETANYSMEESSDEAATLKLKYVAECLF